MGRGVSTPANAEHVIYLDWMPRPEDHYHYDEDENEIPYTDDVIGTIEWDWIVTDEWDYLIEDLQLNVLRDQFPSVVPADSWIGSEDRVIAENSLVQFGVSEYCGTAAIWAVIIEPAEYYYGDPDLTGLAKHWLDQVWPAIEDRFPNRMRPMGTMSNGVTVYRKEGK